MARYVALLRGINVSGRSIIPMADLKRVAVDLGHDEVSTYIQTGNVLFTAEKGDEAELGRSLEAAVRERFGHDVTVMVRTPAELDAVIAGNPFLDRQDDLTKLLVTFLSEPPAAKAVTAIESWSRSNDEAVVRGRDVYLHTPDGYGRSKLTNPDVERVLGVPGTTRNWKSVLKLRELLGD